MIIYLAVKLRCILYAMCQNQNFILLKSVTLRLKSDKSCTNSLSKFSRYQNTNHVDWEKQFLEQLARHNNNCEQQKLVFG